MLYSRYRSIFAFPVGFLLVLNGCGGGGGSSGTGMGGSGISTGSVKVATYQPGTISQSNVETLVKSAYQVLEYLNYTVSYEITGVDPVESNELTAYPSQNTRLDVSASLCTGGGSMTIDFPTGLPRLDDIQSMVFPSGVSSVVTRQSCVSDRLRDSSRFQGGNTTKVLAGYYDAFGKFRSNDAVVTFVYRADGVLSSSGATLAYTDGDIKKTLAGGYVLRLEGRSYKTISTNNVSLEYALKDFSLELEQTREGYEFQYEFTMSATKAFELGLAKMQKGSYLVNILEPLVYKRTSGNIESGKITLSSTNKRVEVTFFSDYLLYRLDLDGDSVYESEATITAY